MALITDSELKSKVSNLSTYQEVAGWKMVPDQTFHLSTEPPRPIAAVWTPAVIQDCCPEQITLLCKNPLSVNLCQNEALLTCHMILKSKSVPQKGGKIMSEPKKKTNKQVLQTEVCEFWGRHAEYYVCVILCRCVFVELWLFCLEKDPTGWQFHPQIRWPKHFWGVQGRMWWKKIN